MTSPEISFAGICALREASCSVLYNPRKSRGLSTLDTSPGMSHLTIPKPVRKKNAIHVHWKLKNRKKISLDWRLGWKNLSISWDCTKMSKKPLSLRAHIPAKAISGEVIESYMLSEISFAGIHMCSERGFMLSFVQSREIKRFVHPSHHTLLFYQIEPLKNGASLILSSSLARSS